VPLLLLGGCDLLQLVAPPPPIPPPPIRQTPEKLLPDSDAHLVPLPTPQQVLTSASLGRRNPFAPVIVPTIPLPKGVAPGSKPALAINTVAKAGGDAAAQLAAAQLATTRQAAVKIQAEKAATGGGRATGAVMPAKPLVLKAPETLQLSGVIQTNGYTEAVVSYGSQSGTLRAGDLGGRTTGLLPAGWSVVAIGLGGHGQADGPSLLLQKGNQRVKVKL